MSSTSIFIAGFVFGAGLMMWLINRLDGKQSAHPYMMFVIGAAALLAGRL
ncbi:hypothetical protein LCGC14_0660070 [marine sediment metagenome]|uniref:Uncharacterized protein n=1 Tax=marine sediment metagenome TaxID=412755 RepID=A0A0F9QYQ6_9ZZZZ